MFYLRKEPHEETIPEIHKTNGEVIPERKYTVCDRAVYKDHDLYRFYRGDFRGIEEKYQGMKLYVCKTLKKIMEIRQLTFDCCGEWFDIYDENGKVEIPETP